VNGPVASVRGESAAIHTLKAESVRSAQDGPDVVGRANILHQDGNGVSHNLR